MFVVVAAAVLFVFVMDLFLHEMSKSFEDVTLGANNTVITPIEVRPNLELNLPNHIHYLSL